MRYDVEIDLQRYQKLREQLQYAVHELPAGILYGADGATENECAQWMQDLLEFERLCTKLEKNHAAFIEGCRWHLEHYPHYLGRKRHFVSYEQYTVERGGPLKLGL